MSFTDQTRDDVRALVTAKRWTSIKLADEVMRLLTDRAHELRDDSESVAQLVQRELLRVADDPELRSGHAGISPRKLRDYANRYYASPED